MILLPYHPRKAVLRSFCLIMSLILACSVGGILIGQYASYGFYVGIIIFLISSLIGIWQPQFFYFPYRVWNKFVKGYNQFLRKLILFITFYLFFFAVGRAGTSLRLSRSAPDESMWISHKHHNISGDVEKNGVRIEDSTKKGLLTSFLPWAIKSGNWFRP